MKRIIISFIFLIFCQCLANAQDEIIVDSVQTKTKEKSPSVLKVLFHGRAGRALAYSLILPGAGQVYNKRIWKVPIIYTGIGTGFYFYQYNNKKYKRFDYAYTLRVKYKEKSTDEFQNVLSENGIYQYRKYYDYYRQISIIGVGILYILNGFEAFVDRHLQEFNISDNLSLRIEPNINNNFVGLKLRLDMH